MNTEIYSVFPACGKTFCYEHQEDYGLKILDLDSSEFNWIRYYDENGKKIKERNPNFPNNYIKHIKENIGKADIIFISTHPSVMEALEEDGIDFTVVFPDENCKAEWIGRCFIRDNNGETGCGAKMMYDNWDLWILDCLIASIEHKRIILRPTEHLSKYIREYYYYM